MSNYINEKISYFIKEYRMRNSLTQEEIANIMDCSKQLITKLERGAYENNISKSTLKKILKLNLSNEEKKELQAIIKSESAKKNIITNSPEALLEELKKERERNKKLEERLSTLENMKFNTKFDLKEMQKIRAFESPLTEQSLIINTMWKLRDENTKYFSQLELLLSMNNPSENLKMKKGLLTVANTLKQQYETIMHYLLPDDDIEVVSLK